MAPSVYAARPPVPRMIRIRMAAAHVVGRERRSRMGDVGLVRIRQAGLLAVGRRMPAEQVIEAPVLHHHDDDVVDARLVAELVGTADGVRGNGARDDETEDDEGQQKRAAHGSSWVGLAG